MLAFSSTGVHTGLLCAYCLLSVSATNIPIIIKGYATHVFLCFSGSPCIPLSKQDPHSAGRNFKSDAPTVL
jgi:hypothetical protein